MDFSFFFRRFGVKKKKKKIVAANRRRRKVDERSVTEFGVDFRSRRIKLKFKF